MENRIERFTEARAWLKKNVPVGTNVYGIVRSVARSGMSRRISLYMPMMLTTPNPKADWGVDVELNIRDITWYFYVLYNDGKVGNWAEGVKVGGCGMDMVHYLISSTALVVHGQENAWRVHAL